MNKNFIKFKNKALRACLVRSVLVGATLGMISGGAFLLLSKFKLVPLPQIAALLIGIGVFLVAAAVAFFLHRASDKSVAKRLDRRFGLNEKVQTMLAYKEEEGTIFALQREDAEASLASLPARKFRIGFLWIYILAFLLGAAALATAFILTPAEEPPPVIPEVPFAISEMQMAALEQLVEYVESSQMQDEHKEKVVRSLNELITELSQVDTVNERDAALSKAMTAIYLYTDESSTAVELINALGQSSSKEVKLFALSLVYYDWQTGKEWDEFYKEMTTLRDDMRHEIENEEAPDEAVMLADTKTLLATLGTEMTSALKKSGVSAEDSLYVIISKYTTLDEDGENGSHAYGFSTLFDKSEGLTYYQVQDGIDELFGALNIKLFDELEQHRINTDTGEYAMTRLSELFDYPLPKFKRPDTIRIATEDNGGGNTDENTSGIGGIGGGSAYGSDDLVLDYNTDKYVEYGTLLEGENGYYRQMLGKLENGTLTDEEKAALEKYFDILYGGFEDEEE